MRQRAHPGLPFRFAETWNHVVRYLFAWMVFSCVPFSVANSWANPCGAVQTDNPIRDLAAEKSGRRLKLRILWGGETEKVWLGEIRISKGLVLSGTSLGMNPDAPVSGWVQSDAWVLQPAMPTSFNGVDLEIIGGPESEVQLVFEKSGEPGSRTMQSLRLVDLIDRDETRMLDDDGNRVTIGRAPGDRIRVDINREHLVFAPGETATLNIAPHLISELAGRQANLKATITPARQVRPLLTRQSWSVQMDDYGSNLPVQWNFQVPKEEGVYDIHLDVEPRWYQASFAASRNSRRVQFVVIDSKAPAVAVPETWRSIGQMRLDGKRNSPGLFPRPNALRGLAGMSAEPAVANAAAEWQTLAPAGWKTIELPIEQIGRPHRIVIEYRCTAELAAGFSILQPDESGNIPSIGVDSGAAVSPQDPLNIPPEQLGKTVKHTIDVWPRHQKPLLLIANRHKSAELSIGSVEIFAGPTRLSVPESKRNQKTNAETASGHRQVLCFLEAPLFADHYGATKFPDPVSGQPMDDWQTFHEGADRWIQSLKASGQTGAMLGIASDGSAICPIDSLQPTPRDDSGTFGSDAPDPVRKDVVEMLMRMFDREGLTLIPAVELKQRTPAIELAKRESAESLSVGAMITADGTIVLSGKKQPVYDPLSSAVQSQIQTTLEELGHRYRQHSCMIGLALIDRPDTWSQLHDEWLGYHPENLQQFSRDTGIFLPTDPGEARNLLVNGEARGAWLQWRGKRMADFNQALETTITKNVPNARLYIAMADTYNDNTLSQRLNPLLNETTNAEAVREITGWNQPTWQKGSQVLFQPNRIVADQPVSSLRSDINATRISQQLFSNVSYPATLFAHRGLPAHFSEVEALNPFGGQSSSLVRFQPMVPAGALNRKRFADTLYSTDTRVFADGGWLPVTGSEDATLEMFQAFAKLPDAPFTDVRCESHDSESSPVRVRHAMHDGVWYGYLVNNSPWTVQTQLQAASKVPLILETWGGEAVESRNVGSRVELVSSLKPYSLTVIRSAEFDPQITGFAVRLPDDSGVAMRERFYKLQNLLTRSQQPTDKKVLRNAGFELGDGLADGWRWNESQAGSVVVMQDVSRPDNKHVVLTGGNQAAWIRSSEFDVPQTGRLSLAVRLRSSSPLESLPLRLSVESANSKPAWYRFGTVKDSKQDSGGAPDAAGWKRFVVHFDNLPVQSGIRLRVGFDLMGPGTVEIDDVQVFDNLLDDRDVRALTQVVASAGHLLNDPQQADRCRRILGGYWPLYLEEILSTNGPQSVVPVSQVSTEMESAVAEEAQMLSDPARPGWRLRRPRR